MSRGDTVHKEEFSNPSIGSGFMKTVYKMYNKQRYSTRTQCTEKQILEDMRIL